MSSFVRRKYLPMQNCTPIFTTLLPQTQLTNCPVAYSELQKWLFGSRKVQVQIVGPEFAGRTTLLYTLMNLGEPLPSTGVPLSWADYDRKTLDYPAGWEFDIVDVWGELVALRDFVYVILSVNCPSQQWKKGGKWEV